MSCRKILTVIVLCLILHALAHDFGCVAFKDNFLYFQNHTDGNITLHVFGAERTGYLGISFYEERHINSTLHLSIVSKITENVMRTLHHPPSSLLPISSDLDNGARVKIDNVFHFTVKVPYQLIAQAKYIGFARSYTGNVTFGFHEEHGFRESTIFNPKASLVMGWCDPLFLKHTGRIFSDKTYLFLPVSVFYFFYIFLVIYLREEQPLKSRGIGPLIGAFGVYGNLIFGYVVEIYWNYEEIYNYGCFFNVFGEYLSSLSTCFIPVTLFVRYVSLINIAFHKEKLMMTTGDSNHQKKLPFRVILLRTMTSPLALVIYIICGMLLFAIAGVIAYSAWSWTCGNPAQDLMRFVMVGIVVVIAITIILLILYDMINNRHLLLKFQVKKYLVDTDHFYHRLEVFSTIGALIFVILWIALPVPSIFHIILCEILYFFIFVFTGGFTTFITLYRYISSKICKKSNNKSQSQVQEFIEDVEILPLLLEFCKHEFSLENVYFKQSIIKYQRITSLYERSIIANEILERFLLENSPLEVNLSASIISQCKLLIENNDYKDTLFLDAEREVNVNLSDTIARFIYSPEYTAYIAKLETIGIDKK